MRPASIAWSSPRPAPTTAFARRDEPATEESELSPVSLYAELKVDFEQFVLDRSDWSLCPTLLRIATAYGLSQRMRFDLTISEFTRTLAVGDELVVYDADTWRPYCHVEDISGAVMTALDADEGLVRSEVFNVGHSDENYTKRMVVDVVQEVLGGAGSVSFEEGGRDPRNYRVNFDKIRERLGFEPQHRVPETVASLVDGDPGGRLRRLRRAARLLHQPLGRDPGRDSARRRLRLISCAP